MYVVSPLADKKTRRMVALRNALAENEQQEKIVVWCGFAVVAAAVVFPIIARKMLLAEIFAPIAALFVGCCFSMFAHLRQKQLANIEKSPLIKLYREWGRAIRRLPREQRHEHLLTRYIWLRRLSYLDLTDKQMETEIAAARSNFPTP